VLLIPLCAAVYPEYIADPLIYICPSSAKHEESDMFYDDGMSVLGFRGVEGDQSYNNWWAASWSYMYWGFTYDRCDDTDSMMDPTGIASMLGVSVPPGVQVPAQVLNQWIKLFASPGYPMLETPYNTRGPIPPLDDDTSDVPADPQGNPVGNGGSNTVYRLREGIERFLITDINYPAASAMAQSEVYIMWDLVSTDPSNFNHVPGGANVLYMDGHVDFIRYPDTKAPVTPSFAVGSGLLVGGAPN
jgi:prepilin-type processing-associated H-X9-DG protein